MRVLVACEFSGIVRDAFASRGHKAWSCDLLPTERPGNHIQGDVREALEDIWDLVIAFPPCTHLAVSGARWFKNKQKEQEDAAAGGGMMLETSTAQAGIGFYSKPRTYRATTFCSFSFAWFEPDFSTLVWNQRTVPPQGGGKEGG